MGGDGGTEVPFEHWFLHATKKELKICCRNWKGRGFWYWLRRATIDHKFRSEWLRSDPEVARIFENMYAGGLKKSGCVIDLEDDHGMEE